jgi:putative MATE family efflux protein
VPAVRSGGTEPTLVNETAMGGSERTLDESAPVWRAMLLFSLPLLMSSILQAVSGTVNNFYLGHMIGMAAFAAAATTLPILYLLISLIVGISSASSILIGQAYGAKDEKALLRSAGTALTFATVSGVVIAVVTVAFDRAIVSLVGTPPEVVEDAISYARILFATMPVLFIFLAYTTFLRGIGDSRTPLVILAIAEVIYVGLTPLLIAGMFGLPRMGILGSPVANAVALATAVVVQWIWLELRRSPLALRKVLLHAWPDWRILGNLVRIGIPTGTQMMMVSLSEVALLTFVNRFGSQATAAFGAVNQIFTYVQFPAASLGIAATVLGAQAIGARRFERIRKIARAGFFLNLAIGGGAIILCYLFARPILGLFLTDRATVNVAFGLLVIALWSYIVYGNTSVLSGLIRSNGKVLWPTLLGILAIWVIEIPAAWILSNGALGLRGVWVAFPLSFAGALGAVFVYYRRVWLPRVAQSELLVR